MGKIYTEGSAVRVTAAFANSAGTASDPDSVSLKIMNPSGFIATLVYGVDSAVVRTGVGAYQSDVVLSAKGRWRYRWEGTGEVLAAEEGFMDVGDSPFV